MSGRFLSCLKSVWHGHGTCGSRGPEKSKTTKTLDYSLAPRHPLTSAVRAVSPPDPVPTAAHMLLRHHSVQRHRGSLRLSLRPELTSLFSRDHSIREDLWPRLNALRKDGSASKLRVGGGAFSSPSCWWSHWSGLPCFLCIFWSSASEHWLSAAVWSNYSASISLQRCALAGISRVLAAGAVCSQCAERLCVECRYGVVACASGAPRQLEVTPS